MGDCRRDMGLVPNGFACFIFRILEMETEKPMTKPIDAVLLERAGAALGHVREEFDRAYLAHWSRKNPSVSHSTIGCYVTNVVLCPKCGQAKHLPIENAWSVAQMQSEFEDFGEECAHCGVVLVAPMQD
jgi:hypothetical protein